MSLAPLAVVLFVGSSLAVTYAAVQIWLGRREDRRGRLVALDLPRSARLLRSEAWALSGRPDEIRAVPDGRWVPVEWKSRPAPARGPLPSHRTQLLAYCLLCEEETGRPPPFGILRYADGREFRVAWDATGRAELLAVRRALARPYDGRHAGSPAKCRGCRWRSGCDVRQDH